MTKSWKDKLTLRSWTSTARSKNMPAKRAAMLAVYEATNMTEKPPQTLMRNLFGQDFGACNKGEGHKKVCKELRFLVVVKQPSTTTNLEGNQVREKSAPDNPKGWSHAEVLCSLSSPRIKAKRTEPFVQSHHYGCQIQSEKSPEFIIHPLSL